MVALEARRAWAAAAAVLDPEVPAVTVAELGILRAVDIDDQGRAVAQVTPTYSGCPAVLAIELAIEAALRQAGFDPVIERVLAPAWTTDWITEAGGKNCMPMGLRRLWWALHRNGRSLVRSQWLARAVRQRRRPNFRNLAPQPARLSIGATPVMSPSIISNVFEERLRWPN